MKTKKKSCAIVDVPTAPVFLKCNHVQKSDKLNVTLDNAQPQVQVEVNVCTKYVTILRVQILGRTVQRLHEHEREVAGKSTFFSVRR